MEVPIYRQSALYWGLVVTVGFPLVTVFLGEVLERLRRRRSQFVGPVRLCRNLFLPAGAVWLLIRAVLEYRDGPMARAGATLLLVAGVPVLLSVLSALVADDADDAEPEAGGPRAPKLMSQLARLVVLFGAAGFLFSSVWGVEISGILTALGLGSVVIALALQDTLSNLVSGVLLVFDRPFQLGAWMRTGDILGQVVDINWRAVRLRTKDGDLVVIPNGLLSKSVVRNYSRPRAEHAERIEVRFSYRDAPNRVRRVLAEVAESTPGVLSVPAPDVRVTGYGELGVSYVIKFWSRDFEAVDGLRDVLLTRIHYAARRSGLTMALLTQTVYQLDGAAMELADKERRTAVNLRSLDVLMRIPPAALEDLEQRTSYQVYAAGEAIVAPMDAAAGIYVFLAGHAAVFVRDRAGRAVEVTRLEPGNLFGDLNVETRRRDAVPVTIKALDDVELLALEPAAVLDLADRNPEFAREIEQLFEAQRRAVERALHLDAPPE